MIPPPSDSVEPGGPGSVPATSPGRRSIRERLLLVVATLLLALLFPGILPPPESDVELLPSLSDEILLFPLALRSADPELFPNDVYLDKAELVFSRTYSFLVGPPLLAAEDPYEFDRMLSILPAAVFFAGCLFLGLRRLGGPWAGLALAALFLFWPMRSYGVGEGDALPRDFLFADFPWLLALLPLAGPVWRLGLFGVALGLLTNLHPLTGAHLALLFGSVTLFLSSGPRRILVPPSVFSVGWLIGAAPYVAAFLALPRSGMAAPELAAMRVPALVGLAGHELLRTWGPVLLLGAVALAASGFSGRWSRCHLVLFAGACAFGVLGGGLLTVPPAVGQFQLGRLARMAGFLALAGTAALVVRAVASRRPRWLAAAGLALLLVATATWQSWFFERAGRRVFGRPPPRVRVAPRRPRGGDLALRPPRDRGAFRELTAWCRENTPEDALFLVPPEEYAPFRLYARRSVVVTRKAGGFAVCFLGEVGHEWAELYLDVSEAYARADPSELAALARRHGAGYVVTELPWTPLDLPVVHREGPFVIHRVPPKSD